MTDIEKTMNGLECCLAVKFAGTKTCFDCPYREQDGYLNTLCEDYLMADALEIIKKLKVIPNHKEIQTNALKNARLQIELRGQRGQKEQYHVNGEYGDHGWIDYLKGIRDACWAVDEMIDGYRRHELT